MHPDCFWVHFQEVTMKYEVLAKTENDQLLINRQVVDEIVSRFPNKKFLLTIQEFEKPKSKEQLGFFFGGIIREAAKFFEMRDDDLYDFLLKKCSTRLITLPNGDQEVVVKRPSGMNMKELSAFISNAIVELSHWGYAVRTPEEYFQSKDAELKGQLVSI